MTRNSSTRPSALDIALGRARVPKAAAGSDLTDDELFALAWGTSDTPASAAAPGDRDLDELVRKADWE